MLPDDLASPVIHKLVALLEQRYVLPDKCGALGERLLNVLRTGGYAACVDRDQLAAKITEDLQAVTADKHLRVWFAQAETAVADDWREFDMLNSWGFARIERLPGNVGYLDLRIFADTSDAGELAAAAMRLLAGTWALIIDLRQNSGGRASMVTLLASYFFADSVHLNNIYWRDGGRLEQRWTLSYVPGPRYLDKPVYLVTSNATLSAAEEFAYDLQQLKRATVVGEPTGGAAHIGQSWAVTGGIQAFVPDGRALHPVTGTNWEGAGVQPDVRAPAERALDVAYSVALKEVVQRFGGADREVGKALVEEALQALAEIDARGTQHTSSK